MRKNINIKVIPHQDQCSQKKKLRLKFKRNTLHAILFLQIGCKFSTEADFFLKL